SSPPGAAPFGYELVFVERRLGEERRGGPQRVGDRYDVVLRLRDDVPTEAFATLQRRFVYLLAIDSHGNSALIWPRPCTSGGEPLPSETLLDKARPEIVLYEDLRVSPPAGID